MKRFFALLLALAMIFSLGINAFATQTEETGSITITNATVGKAYHLYKIFDASIRYKTNDQGEYVVDEQNNKIVEGVSYSIEKTNPYFTYLFKQTTDDPYYNDYFAYVPQSSLGNVQVKENASADAIIAYLTEMVQEAGIDPIAKCDSFELHDTADNDLANDDDLVFANLEPGYYLITSTLGAVVTINSNTPNVKVIDKNQIPATNLDKKVQTGVDKDGNPIWEDANSASLGESFQYKISIETANYDRDKKIMYYQIHDEKGDALWAEFTSIRVFVDGKELPRGYYLAMGGDNTDNWQFLGVVDENKKWTGVSEENQNANYAQWYLVHLGYDQFRITIPWLENHQLVTMENGGAKTYQLTFPEDAESIYPSPSEIEVIYTVGVEANASIGDNTHGNRFNKASASWTSAKETTYTPTDEVVTSVYGIGILKDDLLSGDNLADAHFVVYREYNETTGYSNPVEVIPTGIEGVYAVDTHNSDLAGFSGSAKQMARDYYSILRQANGTPILDDNGEEIVNQALEEQGSDICTEVVTPENGKIVILGLKAGDYYIVEVQPPAAYNALSGHVKLEVGKDNRTFVVYANKAGEVADIQTEDATHKEFSYNLTYTTIHNSKGAQMPATGGEGRMMLISIGTMVAIGFAILLITQKKMSTYKD